LAFVSPATVSGGRTPFALPDAPPSPDRQVAVYPVTLLPPLFGPPNETLTCAFPATTPGRPGAPGTVLGTTAGEAADCTPVPFALVALTVHVYDFPFVRPPTTSGDPAPVVDCATPPFDDVHRAA
jgi:hypothetical protein